MNIKKHSIYFLIIGIYISNSKYFPKIHINCESDTESIVLRFIKQKLHIFNILNSTDDEANLYFKIKHYKKTLIITSNSKKQIEYSKYIGKNTDKHECFSFVIDELFHANKWLSDKIIVYDSASSLNRITEDLFEKNLKFSRQKLNNLPNIHRYNNSELYIDGILLGKTASAIINYVYSSDGFILYICCKHHLYIMPIINKKLFLIAIGDFKGINII